LESKPVSFSVKRLRLSEHDVRRLCWDVR